MKFRKKPIVIEAEQFRNAGIQNWPAGVETHCPRAAAHKCEHLQGTPHVHTLEGPHIADDKDWIITGIKGERYPCKPDIFEATYEVES